MAKKKVDIDKYTAGLFLRTEQYADRVRRHYATAVEELLKLAATAHLGGSGAFSFSDNKKLSEKATIILRQLYSAVYNEIKGGVIAEWEYANLSCDALITSIFGKGAAEDNHFARWFSRNQEAMDAFFKRKSAYGGMNLSQKVWKYTGDLKTEMEMALSVSLGQGDSAATVSRRVRQYLQEPDKLFRRIKTGVDENGNPIYKLSKAAKAYHPGQGVYRSSYKNAMRLTRTETNMAYRASEQDRWQRMDFVIGYEVKLSNNHPVSDICDDLKGKYPKDFVFKGWHPQCRCYVVPILAKEDDFIAMQEKILNGESPASIHCDNEVKHAPSEFNKWIQDNIERAKGWTSMPYFVKDNIGYVGEFKVNTYSAAERKFTRATSTSPAMKAMTIQQLQEKYPQMPTTEKAALYHYTRGDRSDFRQLNKQLMGKKELTEFNKAFSELLSDALKKLDAVEITTYRTIRLNQTELREWISEAKARKKTIFRGFTSTSESMQAVDDLIDRRSRRCKKNENDIILIIKGKNGRRIEDFSQFNGRNGDLPNQQEVLFDRGARFVFEDYQKDAQGQHIFTLRELINVFGIWI